MQNESLRELVSLDFDQPALVGVLNDLSEEEADALDFGVIGFDRTTRVVAYNTFESVAAGLGKGTVLGRPLFLGVAPCMNNYLIAQRFEDAAAASTVLDLVLDYVLTLRMRPVKVVLRLLADPALPTRYVLVSRRG